MLPGLALSIVTSDPNSSSTVNVSVGIKNLYTFNWLFGFVVSIFLYTALSLVFPEKKALVKGTIWTLDGMDHPIDGQAHSDEEHGSGSGLGTNEKPPMHESDAKPW